MDTKTKSTKGVLLLILCATAPAALASRRTEAPLSGGKTTVVIPKAQSADRGAFSLPATNLSLTRRGDFFAGNSFFQNAWVTAPASVAARDGLGPLLNTMSCQSCHVRDGRGRPPRAGEEMVSMLVRISVPSDGADADRLARHGVVGEPNYGDQIQNRAIASFAPEATVTLTWTEESGTLADGTPYRLRRPTVAFSDLAYGDLREDVLTSPRVAPSLIGAGLLDTIPDATLAALCDPEDVDGDGISGRQNVVWDVEAGGPAPGRFGWKAEQPTIRQQVAAAFRGDIGITSSLFRTDALTDRQREIIDAPNGGDPEVSDRILDLVTFYCKTLAVPARRSHDNEVVLRGERLFEEIGCSACHVPRLTTGVDPDFPELSEQEIHPYTDLLLHDMGAGLADGRPSFAASEREWRTPPLWGIGLVFLVNRHDFYLHDGRARSLEEAILWHGGEAQASRDRYAELEREARRALLAFVKSL